MLSVVAAVSEAVNGKVAAGNEGGRRRKLASMTQRLFAAGTSHLPTAANPLGEYSYTERKHVRFYCNMTVHGWSSSAVSTPVTILYIHYHQ